MILIVEYMNFDSRDVVVRHIEIVNCCNSQLRLASILCLLVASGSVVAAAALTVIVL